MKKFKFGALLLALVLALSLALSGCSSDDKDSGTDGGSDAATLAPIAKEDQKIAFIYGSAVGEEGYSYAHDLGRAALAEAGYDVTYVEGIEDAQFEKTVRDLIEQGYNVIFATSYGYGTYCEKLAEEYPTVYFNHATGDVYKDNLGVYMGRLYESEYLAGMAAGLKTESNKIGFVASFPIPEVITQINGFTLGVRAVNPDAVVNVYWTGSWYDPQLEATAGLELANTGNDVVMSYLDTMSAQIAAAEKGVWAIGCSTSGAEVLPDYYLTAPIFVWAEFYLSCVESIADGTWSPERQFLGLDTGTVDIDTLTANNASGAAEQVAEAKQKIIDGDLVVFGGPIKDQSGEVRIAEGTALTDAEILTMDWFVEGVNGNISGSN
ncbi:MAG: BMP family ABC transporter substrate-binding protein [Clostridiales Family XIII bacterium]|jgi:basic membrane protein A|nr:BMP family ABC transporter substrate-binding protein [Clostridiales Family XIII bacterium]